MASTVILAVIIHTLRMPPRALYSVVLILTSSPYNRIAYIACLAHQRYQAHQVTDLIYSKINTDIKKSRIRNATLSIQYLTDSHINRW